jgi:hypothetical protein
VFENWTLLNNIKEWRERRRNSLSQLQDTPILWDCKTCEIRKELHINIKLINCGLQVRANRIFIKNDRYNVFSRQCMNTLRTVDEI